MTSPKLPPEKWTTERVNQFPPVVNLENVGIIDLKEMFEGWTALAEQFPGFAYKYASEHDTPHLAKEFIKKYGSSQDLRFMKMSRELRRQYKSFFARKPTPRGQERPGLNIPGYYGSTKSEYSEHDGLNFRASNQWDNQVRDFENTRNFSRC